MARILMARRTFLISLLWQPIALCVILTGTCVSQETATEQDSGEATKASFYTVDHYDVDANPAEQLQATLMRAKKENKTVLLQVGGDWCGWCHRMTKFIADTESVNSKMQANYLIQKVTFDQKNSNEEFLSDYPKIKGYPHIFVLNAKGEMLHSQNTEELEEGKGYSEEAFVEFLEKWKPKPQSDDSDSIG